MPGKQDGVLKWPAKATFTLELLNHFQNGKNKTCTRTFIWDKPTQPYKRVGSFKTSPKQTFFFVGHSELELKPDKQTHFLKNDALHFKILEIVQNRLCE